MRTVGVGHFLFALSLALVGAIGLLAHDFVLYQQPVPQGIPWRQTLACISGALLLITGIGLLVTPVARLSAIVLTAFLLSWVLTLWIPRVIAQPLVELNWLGVGEDSTLVAGGWIIFCGITGRRDVSIRAARIVFGLALVPIGLSHIVYLTVAAGFIPSWMPFRMPLAAFTGAAHIVAGVAIALDVVPRLAAVLEAVMESSFTLIVWVSAVITTPNLRENWVRLFISTALSAAAWALAESYRREVWFAIRTAGRA
jgi:uncharacterized membrane protein